MITVDITCRKLYNTFTLWTDKKIFLFLIIYYTCFYSRTKLAFCTYLVLRKTRNSERRRGKIYFRPGCCPRKSPLLTQLPSRRSFSFGPSRRKNNPAAAAAAATGHTFCRGASPPAVHLRAGSTRRRAKRESHLDYGPPNNKYMHIISCTSVYVYTCTYIYIRHPPQTHSSLLNQYRKAEGRTSEQMSSSVF